MDELLAQKTQADRPLIHLKQKNNKNTKLSKPKGIKRIQICILQICIL